MTARKLGDVVRLAFEDSKLRSPSSRAGLFQPRGQDPTTMVLSISRTEDLRCAEIFELGLAASEMHAKKKPLCGWLELTVEAIESVHGLKVKYDHYPPRHANIVSWPEDAGHRYQASRKLVAACTMRARFHPHRYRRGDSYDPQAICSSVRAI